MQKRFPFFALKAFFYKYINILYYSDKPRFMQKSNVIAVNVLYTKEFWGSVRGKVRV